MDTETPKKMSFFSGLSALRLDDMGLTAGVSEILVQVPVRKPDRQEFFRIHPDPGHSLPATVFVDREERGETYFVLPTMRGVLAGETASVLLVRAINRQGASFIWPVRLPGEDGWRNTWTTTAYAAAEFAKKHWIRLRSDQGSSGYRVQRAAGELSDPDWPDTSFEELLDLAFKGRVIDTEDHLIVKRLRGLV